MIQFQETGQDSLVKTFARTEGERAALTYPFEFKRNHFLALLQGTVVGRISANLSASDPKRGYFGFFDVNCGSDVLNRECAKGLLASAELWLSSQGADHVVGPVNYSTLFEYRLRLDEGNDPEASPVFSWEPPRRKGFIAWLQGSGYELLEEYHSRAFRDPRLVLPFSQRRYDEALASGFKTRPIEFSGAESPDLRALFRINSSSFQESFLSEPFDFRAYTTLNIPKHSSLLSEFSFFILNPRGQEVGYFFTFPDQGYLVCKTIAVLPEYQKAGLASFGIHHAISLANEKGINRVVSALIRRGAPSESLLSKAESLMIWEHRYGVFSKKLL